MADSTQTNWRLVATGPVASPKDMAASMPVDVPRGMLPIALIPVMPATGIMDVACSDYDPRAVMDGICVATCRNTVEMASSDGCSQSDQGD